MAISLRRGKSGSLLRRVRESKAGAPLSTEKALAKAKPQAAIRKSIREPIERQVGRGSSKVISVPPLLDFSSPQGPQSQPSAGITGGFIAAPPKPTIIGRSKATSSPASSSVKSRPAIRSSGRRVTASFSRSAPKAYSGRIVQQQRRSNFGPRTLSGSPILKTAGGAGAASRAGAAFLRSLSFVGRSLSRRLTPLSFINPFANLGSSRVRRRT